jgi:hypothetical protein
MKRKRPRLSLDPAQVSQLVSVAIAMIVVVLVNVVSVRRYTRWDWTSNQRYSLSPATIETLHQLPETIQIWVLLGRADPMEQSVKQLLVAYGAETTKLDVHYVDPDTDTAALEDVKKRFKIETGRTEQGHVVADAIVVVARGEKHWFLTTADMIEIAGGDDTRVKPKEERALTGAIRNVLGTEKARLCFTTGHGEMSPTDASDRGAGYLKDVLDKDNYESVVVDSSGPQANDAFKQCSVVIIAGLRGAFTVEETERLRTYLLEGGNLLLAASPISGDTPTGFVAANLDRALAPFGIALDDDLVVEEDQELAFPNTAGSRFVATPRTHAITQAIVKTDSHAQANTAPPRVVIQYARSLRKVAEPNSAAAQDLLVTSDKSYGLVSMAGAADWKDGPKKRPGDLGGPLLVGLASERPKISPSAPHGPRIVVLGTASVLTSSTYREPFPLRGAALLVEGAISWLAAKPQVLDVPDRAAVPAGLRITAEQRAEVVRYVLVFMPALVALLGLGVGLWRRSSEGKAPAQREAKDEKKKPAKKASTKRKK